MSVEEHHLTETLTIRPWADPIVDALGHDPRGEYAETFWTPTLGPSCMCLLRLVAARFELWPDGFGVVVTDLASSLGLGQDVTWKKSSIRRTLDRCCNFDVAEWAGTEELRVRRFLPPLTTRQVERLSEPLQEAHAQWAKQRVAEWSRKGLAGA